MEKPVEKSRLRWAALMAGELRRLSEIAAEKAIYGRKDIDYRVKWDRSHIVRYQCAVTLEEAAALETIRSEIMPGMSRYGLTRALLLAAIDSFSKYEKLEGEEAHGEPRN